MDVFVEDYGFLPKRAYSLDAGIDFFSPVDVTLQSHDGAVVDLGVRVAIQPGYYGKMESKSGHMVKHGVICLGGVIDAGFRGVIKIRMYNTSNEAYTIKRGDKIVQMVLIPVLLDDIHQVPMLKKSESGRGENGYGSTGK